ncbi:MAG: hypothetical protein PHF29_08785 [Candidatus Riflebacteria bacterium]|nr:hypothetical protein [Candidatus Riflebacteria bacterium]
MRFWDKKRMNLAFQKRKVSADRNQRYGLSLVECMVGIILFFLVFGATFKAFAPTATSSHNLLRGATIAMNACNWYLNELEQRIQYEGALPASELGETDVTSVFTKDNFSDIKMLRSLKATSNITLKNNLYNAKIVFRWGNSEGDKVLKHNFELSRLLVQPNF